MIVQFNPQTVQAKILTMWNQILPQLTHEILEDAQQYVKVGTTGILRASAELHSDLDHGNIIWQTPYAKRQYWDIRTAYTDYNPLATWRWFETAKENHMSRWEEQAQRLIDAL